MNGLESIKARIAARNALGMTADEYSEHQKQLALSLELAKRNAIRRAILAGVNGDNIALDKAIADCRTLGITQ